MKLINIRSAVEKDIPRIIELYHELTINTSRTEMARNPTSDDYQRIFAEISADPRHKLLVAEQEGEIVGSVVFLIVPNLSHKAMPWALAENLIVTEKHRRKGIGRQLLEHIIDHARENGCHKIELMSNKSREEAHRLYRSIGFEDSALGFRIYF